MGISLPTRGRITFCPIRFLYFSSLGLTAIAVSPNIVSGLVVATVMNFFGLLLKGYFIYHNLPRLSLYLISISEMAVSHRGHQLTILGPR